MRTLIPVVLVTADCLLVPLGAVAASPWTKQITPGSSRWNAVHFVDDSTGWAVGDGGNIVATTDGGDTWFSQSSPVSAQLSGVHFVDSLVGHAVGAGGVILATADGGETWVSQVSPVGNSLEDVSFLDALRGVVVGEVGSILSTADGGASWAAVPSSTSQALMAVDFPPGGLTGYAVGKDGLVLKTLDGGAVWSVLALPGTTELHDVDFLDAATGMVVGGGGTIWATADGGDSWSLGSTPTSSDLWGVSLVATDTAWAVGDSGIVLALSAATGSWVAESSPNEGHDLADVVFPVDGATGWAVGRTVMRRLVDVAGTNSPPVPQDDPDLDSDADVFVAIAGFPHLVPAEALLANDTDPDGERLEVASTSGNTGPGSYSCDSSGCVYAADPGSSGPVTFPYEVIDERGATATAMVTLTVVLHSRGTAFGSVSINEIGIIEVTAGAANEEFVEIYNHSSNAIDVSGWILTDWNVAEDPPDAEPLKISVPDGAGVLKPGEFAVFWSGVEDAAHQAPDAALQFWAGLSPALADSGDELFLYDAKKRIVDHVLWGKPGIPGSQLGTVPSATAALWSGTTIDVSALAPLQSLAITTDGNDTDAATCWEASGSGDAGPACGPATIDDPSYFGWIATPGSSNVGTAPVVAAIPDQTVAEGAGFSVTVSAADPGGTAAVSLSASGLPAWATFTDHGAGAGTISGTPGYTDAGSSLVTVAAFDGAETGYGSFTVKVIDTNRSPSWVAPVVPVAAEGSTWSVGVAASDPDGDDVGLSAVWLPSWASFTDHGSGSGTISGTPGYADAGGSWFVSLEASDGDAVTSLQFDVAVDNTNRPPVIAAVTDQSVAEGAAFSVAVAANDPDGDAVALAVAGLPGWASFTDHGGGSGTISGTPGYADAGSTAVGVGASDGSLGAGVSFRLTVTDTNRAPVVSHSPDRSVGEGLAFSMAVESTDADGDPISLTVSGLPAWASFTDHGDGTGALSGTPGYTEAGTSTVVVVAGDGKDTGAGSFALTVTDVDAIPVWAAPGPGVAVEGTPWSLTVTAVDPDGTAVALSAVALPSWMSFSDPGGGAGTLSGTPGYGDAGTSLVVVRASDGVHDVPLSITMNVIDVNRPPVLTPVADRSIAEGASLSITVTAGDPDGDPVGFAASGLPLWAELIQDGSGAALITGTPGYTDAGTAIVTITASDGSTGATGSFILSVRDVNRAPIWTDPGTLTVAGGASMTVVVGASDPDGDPLRLLLVAGPPWASFSDRGDGTALLTLAPGAAGSDGISLAASDGLASGTLDLSVTVLPANRPPRIDPIGSLSVIEAQVLRLRVTASDPDGDRVTMAVTAVPPWMSVVASGNGWLTLEGTPRSTDVGSWSLVVSARDAATGATDRIDVAVAAANRAPRITAPASTTIVVNGRLDAAIVAVDPEGGPVTIEVVGLPAWASATSSPGRVVISGTPPEEGRFTVVVAARDQEDARAEASFEVIVAAAPVAIAPPPAEFSEKGTLLVDSMGARRTLPASSPSGRAGLTPIEGLMVAFSSVTEAIRSQILQSILLGMLVAWLAIRGLERRERTAVGPGPARSADGVSP